MINYQLTIKIINNKQKFEKGNIHKERYKFKKKEHLQNYDILLNKNKGIEISKSLETKEIMIIPKEKKLRNYFVAQWYDKHNNVEKQIDDHDGKIRAI